MKVSDHLVGFIALSSYTLTCITNKTATPSISHLTHDSNPCTGIVLEGGGALIGVDALIRKKYGSLFVYIIYSQFHLSVNSKQY